MCVSKCVCVWVGLLGDERVHSFASSYSSNHPHVKTETAVIMFHQWYVSWLNTLSKKADFIIYSSFGWLGQECGGCDSRETCGNSDGVCVGVFADRGGDMMCISLIQCFMKLCKCWENKGFLCLFFNWHLTWGGALPGRSSMYSTLCMYCMLY